MESEDPNYQAIALTLNAWVYPMLTDALGDVPMAEASNGKDRIFQQVFDTQADIYNKILSDLEIAYNLFDPALPMIHGTDILYNNNGENYAQAVARMGADDINTKVWWQKE